MIIKYIGHACFKIMDGETGYSIVIDPYEPDSVRGFGAIRDTASEVLCTHDHFDHNHKASIIIEPKEESPFDVECIDTYHDEVKGAKRGPNRIYVITHKKSGEKLIHYGDIGEVLDDLLSENYELLKDADTALIPVGGTYTYDREEALDLIERTSPKMVIPMHYRAEAAGFGLENIGTIEDFLKAAAGRNHSISVGQIYFIDTDSTKPDCDILALRPQNIYVR
jgi:L-ascorbate metabolism protein UlaG (beta-lactamase superfamily)